MAWTVAIVFSSLGFILILYLYIFNDQCEKKRAGKKRKQKVKRVNLLAALVVEWGQKHCAAPATSAAEFVNAGMPVYQV